MIKYEYFINLDERGEFFADVRTPEGTTVFEIKGFEIFQDGCMNHAEDLCNLADYLRDLGIMSQDDDLTFG